MNFSIVIIAKNESLNLPKVAESAKEFLENGGEICLLDTGSSDDTVKVSKQLGFKTVESETNFMKTLTKKKLDKWKEKYKIKNDPVSTPIEFFCFDKARNSAAQISSNDMIFFLDGCDYFINFDYNKINNFIKDGYEQFSIVQRYGNNKGRISRFYNRKKGIWEGHVHEYINCLIYMKSKTVLEETMCIQHRFVNKERSQKYTAGLISTHIQTPKARWHYYLGRELFFSKNYSDCKILLNLCYKEGYWVEERAAAMCIAAKATRLDGGSKESVQSYYQKAYDLKSKLREPYFEVSEWHLKNQNWSLLLESANSGFETIKNSPILFFEEARFHDISNLYSYLYIANWWAGTKELAYFYWKKYVKSYNIDEKNHKNWVFFSELSKNQVLTPYKIVDKTLNDTKYRFISSIDEEITNIPSEEECTIFMKFIRKYVSPNSNAIDIFAGKGFHTVDISKVIHPGIVHSFEPDREKYQEMNTNAFLNSRLNIKSYNDTFSNENIENVGIIHVNCENPLEILQNITEIVMKNKPLVVISNYSFEGPVHFYDFEDLIFGLNYCKTKLRSSIYYIPPKRNE